MLNIGQVVYDYTNERVLIFAGLETLQSQKTGECHIELGFILKDGTFIHLKKCEEKPFKYTNIVMDTKPVIGSLVGKCRCLGYYFGILDGNDEEVKIWAKDAIEEVEGIIAERGLKMRIEGTGDRKYNSYYIRGLDETG
jgi:hypothetical protein